MVEPETEERKKVREALEGVLNRHGYGFQYSVLKAAMDLIAQRSPWNFTVAEFPIEVQGHTTRIDFILQHKTKPMYLLAECKRANPAISNWCFARAPYISHKSTTSEYYFLERTVRTSAEEILSFGDRWYSPGSQKPLICQIATEVKTGEKGESAGQGRGAIEEAATQVLRGLNGMVQFLSKNAQLLGPNNFAVSLPVIFTTASLWTTDADLSSADLKTGKISVSSLTPQGWVAYQYHTSPGLKHDLSPLSEARGLADVMEVEYVRTIPIVNAESIRDFLLWASHIDPVQS